MRLKPLTRIIVTFAICILLTLSPIQTSFIVNASSNTTICVDPPSIVDTSKVPGTTITIAIKIVDAPDGYWGVYSWQARLEWNSSILTYASATQGPFLKEWAEAHGTSTVWVTTPLSTCTEHGLKYVVLSCTLLAGGTLTYGRGGTGDLAYVKFTVARTGSSILLYHNPGAEPGADTALLNRDTKYIGSPDSGVTFTAENGYFSNIIVTHTLTVNSNPISGVDFTIDGTTHTTPWSGSLSEGSHTLVMPSTWGIYNFDHWEDTSTNPTRAISLTADMSITAYYVKRQWTLNVNSNPSGVKFTLDGVTHTTPWSNLLDEGSYTVVMPSTWTVGTDVYNFDHWEDASINPTRVISLTKDTTVTAYYVLAPKYWTLTINSDPITNIEFTLDSVKHTTPYSASLIEGSHTIVMPSTWDIYNFNHWEDTSTNPTHIISLTSDMTITAYYVARRWTLNVETKPITGVDFTLNGVTHTTPWSGLINEGSYTVVMPLTWTTSTGDVYNFDHWEDTSTNPTRAISLTSDMSITAYYIYVPKTYALTVNSNPITSIQFTVDGVTQITPWTGNLAEGSHTLIMPSIWITGTDKYKFDHWEDTSTDPTRTISLTTDTSVTAYYVFVPPTYWTLTVNSNPISGVDFTIDGTTHTTLWSGSLVEGSHTIVMPSTWTITTSDVYNFDHWEDSSKNPTRTISLTSDASITAYYVLAPKYWTLTVKSDPISGVEFTLDGVKHTTPYVTSLIEGSHTLIMPSTWGIYNFDHWEDMSISPTRTISLTADMTVTAYYIARQWTLSVQSDPISGIEFTLDGVTHTTPWSGLINEGSYTILMPSTWTVGTDKYQFDHWEDTSTNPSRIISLTADRTITVHYKLAPTPTYWTLTVKSDPISGVEFTIDSAVHSTPWSSSLPEGIYTVVMSSTWTVGTNVYNFDHWEDTSTSPTRTISLTQDKTITATYKLYVPPVGWIEGYVTDADTGEPLFGATLTADGVSVLTNTEGHYSFEIAPGIYTVTASKTGYESQSKSVTVTAGETTTVDFTLTPIPFTIDDLIALVDEFYELGYIDKEGVKNSLISKLIAAKAEIENGQTETAKNILNAFIHHVKAQSGKHITAEAANILIVNTEYVISHL